LPWSTWAIIAIFLIFCILVKIAAIFEGAKIQKIMVCFNDCLIFAF